MTFNHPTFITNQSSNEVEPPSSARRDTLSMSGLDESKLVSDPTLSRHSKLSKRAAGLAAELMVELDLTIQGFNVMRAPPEASYDLVVEVDGKFIRVQCKGSRAPMKKKDRIGLVYQWVVRGERKYQDNAFEVVACVATDIQSIAYLPFHGQQVVKLSPPGNESPFAKKLKNIDQYDFQSALEKLK